MLEILATILAVGFIAWSIFDSMKVVYRKGTWLELKDPDSLKNDDDKQYIRLTSDVANSTLHQSFPLVGYACFEPDGKVTFHNFVNIGSYKPVVDPSKLERAYQKKTAQQDYNAKVAMKARRNHALESFLK